jgi:hypothetical protein
MLQHLRATMPRAPGIAAAMQRIDAAVSDVRRRKRGLARTP